MTTFNSIIKTLKPGIPKRYLLFVAAVVWTFAGGMLLYRGYLMMIMFPNLIWVKLAVSVFIGVIFFVLMFSKISGKHIARIKGMNNERPCFFSFFSWKGYLMMLCMMSLGIIFRSTGIVSPAYLSVGYIIMGIPLLFSSLRFYLSGFKYFKNIR